MSNIGKPRNLRDRMSAGCSCPRRWTSLTQAHCQACHEQFATHTLADRHHRDDEAGRQTCVPPQDVRTKAGAPVFRSSVEAEGIVWRSHSRRPDIPQQRR